MLVLSRSGEGLVLLLLAAERRPEPLRLRLFVSDVVPSRRTKLAELVEPDGYTPVELAGEWKLDASSSPVSIAAPPASFSGPLRGIRGLFLTTLRSGLYVGAERFAQARDVAYDQKLTIALRLGAGADTRAA